MSSLSSYQQPQLNPELFAHQQEQQPQLHQLIAKLFAQQQEQQQQLHQQQQQINTLSSRLELQETDGTFYVIDHVNKNTKWLQDNTAQQTQIKELQDQVNDLNLQLQDNINDLNLRLGQLTKQLDEKVKHLNKIITQKATKFNQSIQEATEKTQRNLDRHQKLYQDMVLYLSEQMRSQMQLMDMSKLMFPPVLPQQDAFYQ
jgi:DNA repair exonuclease SbcCD ATPase subunit